MRISFLFICVVLCAAVGKSQSIYSYKLYELNGVDSIDFQQFTGKRILLVNIATQHPKVGQIKSLDSLQNRYRDSGLVVIGIPSNSFGNEPGTNEEIDLLLRNRYAPNFLISQKLAVSYPGAELVYDWFSDKNKNELLNGRVKTDFYKILINGQGKIVGLFSDQVDPLDSVLIQAIQKN